MSDEHFGGTVLTFPGQGSYRPALLTALHDSGGEAAEILEAASRISHRFFGVDFLPLVTAGTPEERHAHLERCPDLDQIGIYLGGVLTARAALASGIQPRAVFGHSFGELAALTAAGVFGPETGVKIVCQRVESLRNSGADGGMAALSTSAAKAESLLDQLPGNHGLEIAVINHTAQTVVSGPLDSIQELSSRAASLGVTVTVLKSRFPFHSNHLASAVAGFECCLKGYRFRPARIPVHLGTEGRWLSDDDDVAAILARQFVTRLDFRGAVEELGHAGVRTFIECGGGDIVSKIIEKILRDTGGVTVQPLGNDPSKLTETIAEAARPFAAAEISNPEALAIAELTSTLEEVAGDVDSALEGLRHLSVPASPTDRPATTAPAPGGTKSETSAAFVDPADSCDDLPVAIVSLGCVLPGAADPDVYWRNICEGVSGIIDLAEADPHAREDFMGGTPEKIESDKTYSLLNGSILDIHYDSSVLVGFVSEAEFEAFTRGQRLLALAIGQTIAALEGTTGALENCTIECILGATADGSEEFDEALFADRLHARLAEIPGTEAGREAFSEALRRSTGWDRGASDNLEQHRLYEEIIGRFLKQPTGVYVVDTACSSSLYSIDLGIKSLRDHEADLILAGGVFAPGPANNTLFAQFRGLTPNGSRPLDRAADGVVFADGAGIVALKRLDDALESGDRILGVIRGTGLSSDGKSPSVNVPQPAGQKIAVDRAYGSSGIDPTTIQYVEAHATSTPVGDAAEFQGLADIFAAGRADGEPIELGSVKALIGHTGWASGVASVIKFCKAFEHGTIPRQFFFEAPNPDIDLESSPFVISSENHSWPTNADFLPRRAGINGFGFGGTNAHLIIEEFVPEYHRSLAKRFGPIEKESGEKLAVVGIGSLFPADEGLETPIPGSRRIFSRQAFRLPKKKMLLPDVTEHMDPTQFLASLGAEDVLQNLEGKWEDMRTEIGVVLGITSKTDRGAQADERIFLNRLERRITAESPGPEALGILRKIGEGIREEMLASGPYTLPGLMPNVAAGRVTSLFDLKGPNIVIDRGDSSLWQALRTADKLLRNGDCRLILAGGVNAFGGVGESYREGAVVLGLMMEERAREAGVPILAGLEVDSTESGTEDPAESPDSNGFRGCHLGPEIAGVLGSIDSNGGNPARIVDSRPGDNGPRRILTFTPNRHMPTREPMESPETAAPSESAVKSTVPKQDGAYAFVEGTPIHTATPELCADEPRESAASLENKRILFLVDQPNFWARVRESGALEPFGDVVVATPAGSGVSDTVEIDLSSDDAVAGSLEALGPPPDAVVAVKDLAAVSPDILLGEDVTREAAFADLLFAVSRRHYEEISAGDITLGTVCLSAWDEHNNLHPCSGLLAGFIKSLARELPDADCRCLSTDEGQLLQGIHRLEIEMGQPAVPGEIAYRDGIRHRFRLVELPRLARDSQPCLTNESVVIATGGGRGVTAVLAESLLEQFGCTVIALGRSRLDGIPEKVLEMSEAEFKDWEGDFYREELARDKARRITELRKTYGKYQAANELNRVIGQLQSLPGRFEYASLDINDAEAVERFVEEVVRDHGRVDLLIHGAGIQDSRVMTKKPIELFRRIVSTKIVSLSTFYRACQRHANGKPVHYHILTSAFSYMGNDGQPDYGAANEAMNRTAEVMSAIQPERHWSSMAWLGWAGIGMTRGSEFAALAANRRLRGVTREEGRGIFSSLIAGKPTAPINVLMADGEIEFYGVPVEKKAAASAEQPATPTLKPEPSSLTDELRFDMENAAFLHDHRVHGIPTLPGSFIIGLVADITHRLRPALKITAFRDTRFLKFVSVFESRGIDITLQAEVVSEDSKESLIRVRLLSDFVHKTGRVLQKDILHTEIFVSMAPEVPVAPVRTYPLNGDAMSLPDPYVMASSPVRLNGQFNSMSELRVGTESRTAEYRLCPDPYPPSPYTRLLPNIILVDAFWRFGTVAMKENHTLSVFVPRQCEAMKVFFDYTDFNSPQLTEKFVFMGSNPRPEGDLLHVGPIEVRDESGRVLLLVEGGLCQRFGDIANAF